MAGAGRMRFGVDLGGTKIEIAVLSGDEIVLRRRAATPDSYECTLDTVAALLAEAELATGARAVALGIGTPGSLSPATGLMRNANSTRLNGRALDCDLAARLDRPVRLANDADCFALAEARAGAGRGAQTVFGVILGTGVGGGIVVGGRPLRGPNAIAGEWGHNPLPRPTPDETPGPACWCGRHGCIEAWCSGPGLAADHARHGGVRPAADEARDGSDGLTGIASRIGDGPGAKQARHAGTPPTAGPADGSGDHPTAEGIAARAAGGDPGAAATLARHLDRLGRALAGVVNLLDPDVIVLGGGLSNLRGLAGALPEAMRPHVFSDCFATPLRRHALGDSAGVIGAAWLWGATELETA